ncbi:MAG: helix-turn-helix domain-containing protein [Acidimicrobiaceae bacterium]|nr:helix-turn-helix domain-containing protein [Acidimicrobiaceae bacterium]
MSVAEAGAGVQLETIDDIARRYKIHRATAYRRLQEAGVPIHKIGRSSRVVRSDVDRAFGLMSVEPDPELEPEPERVPGPRGPGRPRKHPEPEALGWSDRLLAERAAEVAELAADLADKIKRRSR